MSSRNVAVRDLEMCSAPQPPPRIRRSGRILTLFVCFLCLITLFFFSSILFSERIAAAVTRPVAPPTRQKQPATFQKSVIRRLAMLKRAKSPRRGDVVDISTIKSVFPNWISGNNDEKLDIEVVIRDLILASSYISRELLAEKSEVT